MQKKLSGNHVIQGLGVILNPKLEKLLPFISQKYIFHTTYSNIKESIKTFIFCIFASIAVFQGAAI